MLEPIVAFLFGTPVAGGPGAGRLCRCGLAGELYTASVWTRVEPRGDDGYRMFDVSLLARQFVGRTNAYLA